LHEEANDDQWGKKKAYDQEVMRSHQKVPEFRNADIGDSFKQGAFFDDPDFKPMRSNGRGQRGNPTGFRDRNPRRQE